MATIPTHLWSVGEFPIASLFNTRIRDSINFIKSPPLCILRKNASQGLSSGLTAAVSWQVEDLDTDGGHSNVTNNTRYTAQTPGWFLLCVTLNISPANTGFRDVWFRKNGTNSARYGWHTIEPRTTADGQNISSTAHVNLAVNDYVEVMAQQDSGASLNIVNDGNDPRFEARWVHL